MKREITLEEATKVITEFPDIDDYVQAHYQQFLTNGEHNDNTIDSANYWNKCKRMTRENDKIETPDCCSKPMKLAPSGNVYECGTCGYWQYTSS